MIHRTKDGTIYTGKLIPPEGMVFAPDVEIVLSNGVRLTHQQANDLIATAQDVAAATGVDPSIVMIEISRALAGDYKDFHEVEDGKKPGDFWGKFWAFLIFSTVLSLLVYSAAVVVNLMGF